MGGGGGVEKLRFLQDDVKVKVFTRLQHDNVTGMHSSRRVQGAVECALETLTSRRGAQFESFRWRKTF